MAQFALDEDEKTVVEGNVNLHAKTSLIFKCEGCQFQMKISEKSLRGHAFMSQCIKCGQKFAIQHLSTDLTGKRFESKGCTFLRAEEDSHHNLEPSDSLSHAQILEWIDEDRETTQERLLRGDKFENTETIVDQFVSRWTVRTKSGAKFEFQYFAQLRKAIQKGSIHGNDIITAPDGLTYQLDQYPGTADLFGNNLAREQARQKLNVEREPGAWIKQATRVATRFVYYSAVVVGLASFIYQAPHFIEKWKVYRGEKALSNLLNSDIKIDEKLRTDLESKPISEAALVEAIRMTMDRSLDDANRLISYAEFQHPGSPAILTERGRWLAKSGEGEKALAHFAKYQNKLASNREALVLYATIAMNQNDFTKASLIANEALALEPNNTDVMFLFADIFERQSKFAQAAKYLEDARALSDQTSEITRRLARLYAKENDIDSSVESYRTLLTREDAKEEDALELLNLLNSSKRFSDITLEATRFFSKFPTSGHVSEVQALHNNALAKLAPPPPPENPKARRNRRMPNRD